MKRLKRDDLLISLFEEHDRRSVIDIWSQAFSDTEEFINNFLDFSGAKVYVYRENGAVLGMFSVFDVEAHGEKGAYIYALAVEEKHRRKSIASKMLEFADEILSSKGYAFSIVVPEPYTCLEAFYKKRGYETEIELSVEEIDAKGLQGTFKIQVADASEYFSARNMSINVLKHDERFFKFLYDDMKNDGAEVLKITFDKQCAFCVCYCREGYVIIKEVLGTVDISLLAQIIAAKYSVEKIFCVSHNGAQRYPYALLKKYDLGFDCNIYANLLLDSFELRF